MRRVNDDLEKTVRGLKDLWTDEVGLLTEPQTGGRKSDVEGVRSKPAPSPAGGKRRGESKEEEEGGKRKNVCDDDDDDSDKDRDRDYIAAAASDLFDFDLRAIEADLDMLDDWVRNVEESSDGEEGVEEERGEDGRKESRKEI